MTKTALRIAQQYTGFPYSCFKNYESITEIPERVPSLKKVTGVFELPLSVENTLTPDKDGMNNSITQDLMSAGITQDVTPIVIRNMWNTLSKAFAEEYALKQGWFTQIHNMKFKDDVGWIIYPKPITEPKTFVRFSRVCALFDEIVKNFFNRIVKLKGNGPFSNYYEKLVGGFGTQIPMWIEQASTLEDFLLTANCGSGVSSCHNPDGSDSEYKFGQWTHLLNPSIGNFFLSKTPPSEIILPKPRIARCNVLAVWDNNGKHMWIISREYAANGYRGILDKWLFNKAKEMGITVIYYGTDTRGDTVRTQTQTVYGQPFNTVVRALPTWYPDRNERIIYKNKQYSMICVHISSNEFITKGNNTEFDLDDKSKETIILDRQNSAAIRLVTEDTEDPEDTDDDDDNNEVECRNCGGSIDSEEASYINDNYYCNDCTTDCYCCEDCSVSDDMYKIDGKLLCESCYENEVIICELCGSKTLSYEDSVWCQDCYEHDTNICITCGDRVTVEAAGNTDPWLCQECWDKSETKIQNELNDELNKE